MILSGVMGIFPMILKSGHMQMVIDAPYISGENDSSDDSYLD